MPGLLSDLPNAFLVNALRCPDQLVLVHLDQPFLPASACFTTHGAEPNRVGQFCSIIPSSGGSVLLYRNHHGPSIARNPSPTSSQTPPNNFSISSLKGFSASEAVSLMSSSGIIV